MNKPDLELRKKQHQPGQLRSISIDVTPKCNMHCKHCYADTFMHSKQFDLTDLQRVLVELKRTTAYHYILQGGEPIVDMKRLLAIIAMIGPEQSFINVVSNGWDMSYDRLMTLAEIGVDKVAFSMDSGIPKEHDAIRGTGSWNKVSDAIKNAKYADLITSISMVVTHDTLHSDGFLAAVKFAVREQIRLDVQIAMPVGRWDGKQDILINHHDACYIKQLQQTHGKLINGQWLINRDVFNFGGEDHCPAAIEFMAIAADGTILPCNFCQFSLGNIKDTSLIEAREKIMKSSWFQGKIDCCLLGEHQDFFDKFVTPYVNQPKPLDAAKLFNL